MRNLFKWLARWRRPEYQETSLQASEHSAAELSNAYRELVAHELSRWGVPDSAVTIEIRRDGQSGGVASFAALVHLLEWNGMETLPLLLGLPFLERKLRRALQSHWLADVSAFSGLWLHAPEGMLAAPGSGHLRELLMGLTNHRAPDSIPAHPLCSPDGRPANGERAGAALRAWREADDRARQRTPRA